MSVPDLNMICRYLLIALLTSVMVSCAPPPGVTPSGNLTLDMRRMQATLDRQEQNLENLSRQLAEIQSQQEQQAREIERLSQIPPTVGGDPSPSLPRTTGPIATGLQGDGSPTEIYLQAFGDYASGRYQSAVLGFGTFLQLFPNNSYASSAQFWLADCYFNQQQYPMAIQEFERVLNNYSEAAKNPDALYKIAIAQLQLGATDEARQAIDLLVRRYPKSTATQKAQELVIP